MRIVLEFLILDCNKKKKKKGSLLGRNEIDYDLLHDLTYYDIGKAKA